VDTAAQAADSEYGINAAAVAAYRASLDHGKPLSERKLAAMFGTTSRRWARHRMAEAHQIPVTTVKGKAWMIKASKPKGVPDTLGGAEPAT
jgi:hypothetical protein